MLVTVLSGRLCRIRSKECSAASYVVQSTVYLIGAPCGAPMPFVLVGADILRISLGVMRCLLRIVGWHRTLHWSWLTMVGQRVRATDEATRPELPNEQLRTVKITDDGFLSIPQGSKQDVERIANIIANGLKYGDDNGKHEVVLHLYITSRFDIMNAGAGKNEPTSIVGSDAGRRKLFLFMQARLWATRQYGNEYAKFIPYTQH